MINPGPARALAELASRATEMLHAYEPGYETSDDQIRSATLARSEPALDAMSVAGPESAYFVGRDAAGKTFYSRDGSFRLDGANVTWADGSAVLGYAPGAPLGAPLQALRVDPVDAALGRVGDPHVEADGSVVYTRTAVDPQTGKKNDERVVAGRIALARFPAGSALPAVAANRVAQPAGVAPSLGAPGVAGFGNVTPKARDLGSVDFESGLNQLREAFLALDAMSASDRVDDRDAHVAMDLIK
jgi:prepilin-type processing-associated H-X9-DG protein